MADATYIGTKEYWEDRWRNRVAEVQRLEAENQRLREEIDDDNKEIRSLLDTIHRMQGGEI